MLIGVGYYVQRSPFVNVSDSSGYAGVPINPSSTSVSFVPRGEMDGEATLKLLVNVRPSNKIR